MPEALAKVDEASKLEQNWDSYGAPPIPALAIAAARSLLLSLADLPGCPAPRVTPTNHGGVSLYWGDEYLWVECDKFGPSLTVIDLPEAPVPPWALDAIKWAESKERE